MLSAGALFPFRIIGAYRALASACRPAPTTPTVLKLGLGFTPPNPQGGFREFCFPSHLSVRCAFHSKSQMTCRLACSAFASGRDAFSRRWLGAWVCSGFAPCSAGQALAQLSTSMPLSFFCFYCGPGRFLKPMAPTGCHASECHLLTFSLHFSFFAPPGSRRLDWVAH